LSAADRLTLPPSKLPRREDLEGVAVCWLKRAGPTKADLLLVDLGEGPLVVKDFARKAAWVRLIGRLQIARECGAYRWLGPRPFLPHLVGRIDAHALALAQVDGVQLAFHAERRQQGAELHARLGRAVEALHAAGLVHLDLRGRENVLLGAAGEVYLVDLASAMWFRPGGLAWRLVGRPLALADRAALLKWKRILGAGPLTEAEARFAGRFRRLRVLWPFNRKG